MDADSISTKGIVPEALLFSRIELFVTFADIPMARIPKNRRPIFLIRMFRKFFLTATGEDVLKDCEDAQEAKEAYDEFLSAVREQKEHFLSPYSLERIK